MRAMGMVLALLAACCSAGAAVLQAISARKIHMQRASIVRLIREPGYLIALSLIATGFVFAFAALRYLPLFAVQSVRAANLGITAVILILLGAKLRKGDVVGIVIATVGLVLVGLTAAIGGSTTTTGAMGPALLGTVLILALVGVGALQVLGNKAGIVAAIVAGCGFACLALGARLLSHASVSTLILAPEAWASGCGGLVGLVFGALAYQRASVIAVTSTIVAVETITSSALGLWLTGDRPIAGQEMFALGGCILALVGALLLARFGEIDLPD